MEDELSPYEQAAIVLLQNHYSEDDAAMWVEKLWEKWEKDPMALMTVATVMALQPDPWWESPDPLVRAIQQLECETMLLESFEALMLDVETCLERSLGATDEERQQTLFMKRDHLLCELKGEPPPEPNPMDDLMARFSGMLSGKMPIPDTLHPDLTDGDSDGETFDDFGAPTDQETETWEDEGGSIAKEHDDDD